MFLLILANAMSPLPGPSEAGWNGQRVCEIIREDEEMRVLRCTFAPGIGHERHRHPRHFGYALSGGKMRITDAKGVRDVDILPGSSFSSEGIVWHEVLNIGDTPVQYLIVEPK